MREELIGFIGLFVSLYVSILYNRHYKRVGSRKHRFIEKAKKAGCVTEGVPVSTRIEPGIHDTEDSYLRATTKVVKYRYEVNGKAYYKKLSFQDPGMLTVRTPDTITVYYDPANPKKSVYPGEATGALQRAYRIYGAILVFIAVMFVVVNVLNMLWK